MLGWLKKKAGLGGLLFSFARTPLMNYLMRFILKITLRLLNKK